METEVAQIFPHYFPVLVGAAERFRRYAPGLLVRGVSTSVITTKCIEDLSDTEIIDGVIEVHRISVGNEPEKRDSRLFSVAEMCLSKEIVKAKVVQTIKSDRKLLKHLWGIKRQGKALISVSTMVENEIWGRSFFNRWINRELLALSQRLFDAVAVGSSVMAESQLRFGAKLKQLHVISHGVNTKRFCPNIQNRKSVIPTLPANARVCLFVGNLIPRKGIHLVLESWVDVVNRCPDAWLVLVGGIDRPTVSSDAEKIELAEYQRMILRQIADTPQVIYAGEQKKIEDWYQSADVFVFPSRQEGFPNALLEAMSSGLPCLTSNFTGFPFGELDEDLGSLLVVPASQKSWSESIVYLLENPNLRKLLGLNARQVIVKKHDLNKTLDQYSHLYHMLGKKAKII